MENNNPYETPQAEVEVQQHQFYQPKLFSFNGRLNRLRYVSYIAFTYMLLIVPLAILAVIGISGQIESTSIIVISALAIFILVFVVFSLAVLRRRLNDMGRSGWWAIVSIIPLLGSLFLIYVMFAPGDEQSNAWGLPAQYNPIHKGLAFIAVPIYLFFIVGSFFGEYGEQIQQFYN